MSQLEGKEWRRQHKVPVNELKEFCNGKNEIYVYKFRKVQKFITPIKIKWKRGWQVWTKLGGYSKVIKQEMKKLNNNYH